MQLHDCALFAQSSLFFPQKDVLTFAIQQSLTRNTETRQSAPGGGLFLLKAETTEAVSKPPRSVSDTAPHRVPLTAAIFSALLPRGLPTGCSSASTAPKRLRSPGSILQKPPHGFSTEQLSVRKLPTELHHRTLLFKSGSPPSPPASLRAPLHGRSSGPGLLLRAQRGCRLLRAAPVCKGDVLRVVPTGCRGQPAPPRAAGSCCSVRGAHPAFLLHSLG